MNQQPQQQLEREEQRPPGRDERREAEGNEAERHAEGDGEEELEEEERAVLDNGGPQVREWEARYRMDSSMLGGGYVRRGMTGRVIPAGWCLLNQLIKHTYR